MDYVRWILGNTQMETEKNKSGIKLKYQCVICDGIETLDDIRNGSVRDNKLTIEVMKLCTTHLDQTHQIITHKITPAYHSDE